MNYSVKLEVARHQNERKQALLLQIKAKYQNERKQAFLLPIKVNLGFHNLILRAHISQLSVCITYMVGPNWNTTCICFMIQALSRTRNVYGQLILHDLYYVLPITRLRPAIILKLMYIAIF